MTARQGNRVAAVYDRVAWVYDLYTRPMETLGGEEARARLFSRARGRVLDLGIGTGANLPFFPADVKLTGMDVSQRMLERARRRAVRLGLNVALLRADIEQLPYSDNSFDTVAAACTFCSVAHPLQGLREAGRVTRPDGLVLLYEHVRPTNPFLGRLADVASPVIRRTIGPEINRRTERSVVEAGMTIIEARRNGIWRDGVATPSVAR